MKTISLSGVDGSGKSTAWKYLADQLEARGFRVLRTREVGSPHIPVCSKLRELVLDPAVNMDPKAMEFIFAAMRIENQKFYDSVQDQYDFAISDRGWFDHLAYTDHNVNPDFTTVLYNWVVLPNTTLEEYVIYMKIDPRVSWDRKQARGTTDVIENKGLEFQEKVSDSFDKYTLQYARVYTSDDETVHDDGIHVHQINAEGAIEEVQAELDSFIDQVLLKTQRCQAW